MLIPRRVMMCQYHYALNLEIPVQKKYGVVPLTHLNSAVLILVFVNMILLWPTIGMAISISVGCMEKWWAWTFAFQKEENSFIESARV